MWAQAALNVHCFRRERLTCIMQKTWKNLPSDCSIYLALHKFSLLIMKYWETGHSQHSPFSCISLRMQMEIEIFAVAFTKRSLLSMVERSLQNLAKVWSELLLPSRWWEEGQRREEGYREVVLEREIGRRARLLTSLKEPRTFSFLCSEGDAKAARGRLLPISEPGLLSHLRAPL